LNNNLSTLVLTQNNLWIKIPNKNTNICDIIIVFLIFVLKNNIGNIDINNPSITVKKTSQNPTSIKGILRECIPVLGSPNKFLY